MGTSPLTCTDWELLQDHPHAYGDKSYAVALASSTPGSSPRVWGQVKSLIFGMHSMRIIPTRMGTSCPRVCFCVLIWDHPHAYGDKFFNSSAICNINGSSPRVWGQVLLLQRVFRCTGIIPTRMGTSLYDTV